MDNSTTIPLPLGYQLRSSGFHVEVARASGGAQPFAPGGDEGGWPVRVEVIALHEGRCVKTVLREKDFQAASWSHDPDGAGAALTANCRGLVVSHCLRWRCVERQGRPILCVSRRVRLEAQAIDFPGSDHVRLLALTRWGALAEGQSFELVTGMEYRPVQQIRSSGLWITPCVADADVSANDGKALPSNAHESGMADYTVLAWPRQRCAVMVALDPLEFLERNINPESVNVAQRGPAQTGFTGWLRPGDEGAIHETPWQHYYFLDQDDEPFFTAAALWRDHYARRLNDHLQPIEELEPWFATENLLGPRVMDRPHDSWDGNLTALERHYEALRRDPLDQQVYPLLFHERPGFCAITTNKNQYHRSAATPAGRVTFNVPLFHRRGDRFTISCEVEPEDGSQAQGDLGLEVEVEGACFRFESAALRPFQLTLSGSGHKPYAPAIAPRTVQAQPTPRGTRVRIACDAQDPALQAARVQGYHPVLEISFRVERDIASDEGVVTGRFLHRRRGEDAFTAVDLVAVDPVVRGEYTFPRTHLPLRVRAGMEPAEYAPLMQFDYHPDSIYYEVRDGRPTALEPAAMARRLGEMMARHNAAITLYVPAYSIRDYDFSRNALHETPKALALDPDQRPHPRFYYGWCRSNELCPACEENNRRLDECLRQFLAWGPFGVYYDELLGGAPASCFGRDHGHGLSQHQRLAHRRGERMRRVARQAGRPAIYIGTENGGFLQHTFAQGHNFAGIDPSRKDGPLVEAQRLMIGQAAYDFPGSRAYFNYVFQDESALQVSDGIFGHALGLAFPRFALAPFTLVRRPISYYFAAAVKRAFPDHYCRGATDFPREALRPGAPPLGSVALALRSESGLSVHLANLSGDAMDMEKEGFSAQVAHGCAVLADTFGNLMGKTQAVRYHGQDHLRCDRPAAFGLWRTTVGQVYLQALELDFSPLRSPLEIFVGRSLLAMLGIGAPQRWRKLDAQSTPAPIECRHESNGQRLIYPVDSETRCLMWV